MSIVEEDSPTETAAAAAAAAIAADNKPVVEKEEIFVTTSTTAAAAIEEVFDAVANGRLRLFEESLRTVRTLGSRGDHRGDGNRSDDDDGGGGKTFRHRKEPGRTPSWWTILRDRRGSTPLHYAAGNGNLAICRCLLSAVAEDARGSGDDGEEEDKGEASGSIAGGASDFRDFVDLPNRVQGRTALHWAARNGHLEICELLVTGFGADPGPLARGGVTPLQLAIWRGHLDVCVWLSSSAPKAGSITGSGGGSGNNTNSKCFVNGWGCTVHHWLAKSPIYSEEREEQRERRRPKSTEDGSASAPPYDAEARLLALCEWLDDDDDGGDATGADHWTRPNDHGQTPLHKAGFGGNLPVVRFLLHTKKCSDSHRDSHHNTAADCAERNRQWDTAKYLRRHGNPPCLETARAILFPNRSNDDGSRSSSPPSLREVREAYLTLARSYHPDRRFAKARRTANENDDGKRWRDLRAAYRLWSAWWTDPDEADDMIRGLERHRFLRRKLPPLILWHRRWHDDTEEPRGPTTGGGGGSRSRGNGVGSSRQPNEKKKKKPKLLAATAFSEEAKQALEDFERRLVRLLETLPLRGVFLSQLPKEYEKTWTDSAMIRPRDYRCKKLGFLLEKHCGATVEVVPKAPTDPQTPGTNASANASANPATAAMWVRLRERRYS